MNIKETKQVILNTLKKKEFCFKNLIKKIEEQKKAIEIKDETRVLKIIGEKNKIIETFHGLEDEVNFRQELLSPKDIKDLAQEGKILKISLEKLLETIISMEEECENEISLNMQEIEKKILKLREGKKIGREYGGFLKNKPLFSRKV